MIHSSPSENDAEGPLRQAMAVKILDQVLHFHPQLAYTLQDLSVDILFASIGQELRKLHFRVTCCEMIGYMIVR